MAAVLGLVVVEIVQAKGIHREKRIASNVPVARVAEAGRMIENGHAYGLSADLRGVVDPAGGLPPAALFALPPLRILDVATALV